MDAASRRLNLVLSQSTVGTVTLQNANKGSLFCHIAALTWLNIIQCVGGIN